MEGSGSELCPITCLCASGVDRMGPITSNRVRSATEEEK